MPRPTREQIIAGLAKFKADPRASQSLLAVVCDHISFGLTDVTTILAKPAASITVEEISKVIPWLKTHWAELSISQQLSFRSDLAALRTGPFASARVRAYINQAMLRFPSVGDDDEKVMCRLKVVLDLKAENVDVDEFQHLMARARVIYSL